MIQPIHSIYIDRFEVGFNDYTFTLKLGNVNESEFYMEIKLTPEIAKQLHLILRQATRMYEYENGTIRSTPKILEALDIPKEDWDA